MSDPDPIAIIEKAFPGVTVKLIGYGQVDDYLDDTPQYEAYNVPDEDYARFEDFTWDAFEDTAVIEAISPEETKKHRPKYAIKEKS